MHTPRFEAFEQRHIGPDKVEQQHMLASLGMQSFAEFLTAVVPDSIRLSEGAVPHRPALDENAALSKLKSIAAKNVVHQSFIGQGYYNAFTPAVIQRNVLENPAWYTAYTPYQPEISQGRLEALLNFQTMVCDLTGLDIANASLLDEATAAAEAMALARRMSKSKSAVFYVDEQCFGQTIEVLKTRSAHLGIELKIGPASNSIDESFFGLLLQYPGADGEIRDVAPLLAAAKEQGAVSTLAADILALSLLRSPGELGADIAIGNTQRFGVPLGFGGPHAAYMSCRDAYKRSLPGRIVGVSVDQQGRKAYRLALQTREQHIRREKATSNICTAQALLAIMASSFAVYHGPRGITEIAERVASLTASLKDALLAQNVELLNHTAFDTLTVNCGGKREAILQRATEKQLCLREINETSVGVSLDECTRIEDIVNLVYVISGAWITTDDLNKATNSALPSNARREDAILQHPVFNQHHSETEMLRYLRWLSDKDIALDRAMIPLGSCTMKLNASSEMQPISWPEFANIHPFAPQNHSIGYRQMIDELEQMLCEATGYDAVSLQPNAGSQGEYAGLLAIKAYHESRGDMERDLCLIPSSAHGTNPASAHMCGMRIKLVKCDAGGNVDIEDLRSKASEHAEQLAAIMITYPSTHGVFETHVREVCNVVHEHGGQVYIDGANLNAMIGLAHPGEFGGDVSHLNLHKTFCIPHGGGGPGVGPIGVKSHLEPFLPGHAETGIASQVGAVSASPWGSAGILPISWMYIAMMGSDGLQRASEVALLNANYIAQRLKEHFPILYVGENGLVAHECILDLRPLKASTGIDVEDVAKRLIDYGFHAPTMSFPVAGTLMVEPTESESLQEIDRFCEAMISIREEIAAIEKGCVDAKDNVLTNAPHAADTLLDDHWSKPYTRSQAAYPNPAQRQNKYWPPVGRVDNVYGDRNLVCSCPPIDAYEEQ